MSGRERFLTLVGLTGRAGAGKDTSANVLKEWFGLTQIAFSDPLRQEIVDAFGVDLRVFGQDAKEVRSDSLAICRCADLAFIDRMRQHHESLTAARSPREIMRWWGTEYRRADDPAYWTRRMIERIDALLRVGVGNIVISDVRFPNEYACVWGLGGTVWRIRRAQADRAPVTHASEETPDGVQPDYLVDNDTSIEELGDALALTLKAATSR